MKELCKLYRVSQFAIVKQLKAGKWGAKYVVHGVKKPGWRVFCPPTFDPVMLPVDVARIVNVSHQTVLNWCRSGVVKAFQIGELWRIDYEDGIKLISKRK